MVVLAAEQQAPESSPAPTSRTSQRRRFTAALTVCLTAMVFVTAPSLPDVSAADTQQSLLQDDSTVDGDGVGDAATDAPLGHEGKSVEPVSTAAAVGDLARVVEQAGSSPDAPPGTPLPAGAVLPARTHQQVLGVGEADGAAMEVAWEPVITGGPAGTANRVAQSLDAAGSGDQSSEGQHSAEPKAMSIADVLGLGNGTADDMRWMFEACEPHSGVAATKKFTRHMRIMYSQMKDVHPRCVFAGRGRWVKPINVSQLDAHADALIEAAADGRVRLCSAAELHQTTKFQFAATVDADVSSAPPESTTTTSEPGLSSTTLPSGDTNGNSTDSTVGAAETQQPRPTEPAGSLRRAKLRHATCELPDTDQPYLWLVMLTAVARRVGHERPWVAFVGDSVHRNIMSSLIAVLRSQRETVLDRQSHLPIRYVVTNQGDCWESQGKISLAWGSQWICGSVNSTLPGPGNVPVVRLLELNFDSVFSKRTGDIPWAVVPRATPEQVTTYTAVIGGGLLHTEARGGACHSWRIHQHASIPRYAHRVVDYAADAMPRGQTYIFRAATTVVGQDDMVGNTTGLPSHHDRKDFAYREAMHKAVLKLEARHASSVSPQPTETPSMGPGESSNGSAVAASPRQRRRRGLPPAPAVFFMDALEQHESQLYGMQPMHRQLRPLDHVHYTCVAHDPIPKGIGRWTYGVNDCRSFHDKAHAALTVAMAASQLMQQPPTG